ncbi:MAG: preprotein translocase subunit SecG [Halothiobacillaceae bacterium]|nr:preprotein translocase subunit SecG [Halothiobacillaceae bacterium]
MTALLTTFHILVGMALIGLVLVQHGKGAEAGAAFGGGASSTVFGARGAATFLSRLTAWLVAIFFVTSLLLAYIVTSAPKGGSVVETAAPLVTQPAVTDVAPQESKPADVPAVK